MRRCKCWIDKCLLIFICMCLTYSTTIRAASSPSSDNVEPLWYEIGCQPREALTQLELWINTKTFKVNGQGKTSDVAPMISGGRTLIPIRVISEGLGADITWNSVSRKVLIQQESLEGKRDISFIIGDRSFYVDGAQKQTDVPPLIVNGRTMVPIRAVSESLESEVSWDANERKVTVKGLNLRSDADKDGLTLAQEHTFGTNPNQNDNLAVYRRYGEPDSDFAFEEGTMYVADVSGDWKVDQEDYDRVKSAEGTTPTDSLWNYRFDVDGNKIVDGKDLLAVYVNLGKGYKFLDLLNRLDSAGLKDDFVKHVLSKIIASGKDIETGDVQDYLDLLMKSRKETAQYLLNTGFSWEDGVQNELEKQVINQYVDGNVGGNLISQLQDFYLGEMEKRFPGMKDEILNLPEFGRTMGSLEALEDVYGQAMRSEPYAKPEDSFDPLKITHAREIWELFSLMLKGGHLCDERRPNKEKTLSMAKTLKVDGDENDWENIGDAAFLVKDRQGDTDDKRMDFTYLKYTLDEENLYILMKTVDAPSRSSDIQYFVHIDDGEQLGGMDEYSIAIHPGTNEASLYNNENQRDSPIDVAINNAIEMKIPLASFETEDVTKLGIADAGAYVRKEQSFPDMIPCHVLVGDLLQDFSYDIAAHNFQLQGLFQLCLDDELSNQDTTAFAISTVDSIYRAMGDEEVRRQVRLDDSAMLTFSRTLDSFLKQRNATWDFNTYPLEAKIAWSWRGCHTVTHGVYRLVNRYSFQGTDLDNFIDRTQERLSLYEYQWDNVGVETLKEMQEEIVKRSWMGSTPSETTNTIRTMFIKGSGSTDHIWIAVNTGERTESYAGRTYVRAGLDSATFEWSRYKRLGMGIGACEDSMVFSQALLESVGIPTLSATWRVVSPFRDISNGRLLGYNSDAHAIPMFLDVAANRWRFNSLDASTGKEFFKEDGYFEAFVFMPPVRLQGYLHKVNASANGCPPKAERDDRGDNNAWKQFYDLGYGGFRGFLSAGLSDTEVKRALETNGS
jgi:hypothetical protein